MVFSDGAPMDQSWVAGGDTGSDISWAEDSDRSEPYILDHKESPRQTKVKNATPEKRRRLRDNIQVDSSLTEHDFQMPSYESVSPQKGPRVNSQTGRSLSTKLDQRDRRVSASTKHLSNQRPIRQQSNHNELPAILSQVAGYVLEILASTLKKLKQPISWALAAYLFAGILVLVQNFLSTSISNALSPICRVPGAFYLNLPICSFTSRYPTELEDEDIPTIDPSTTSKEKKRKKKAKPSQSSSQKDNPEPEFDNLMQVQSHFSQLIDSSASPAALNLPLDMKRSETSIRDLKQIVRFSSLSSRHELVHEFDGFIETARIASYDLQKFNSHVGRAVDNVLSTTRWTSRALSDIATERTNRGIIPSFVQDRLLAPFQPLRFSEGRVLEQYIVHSRVVSEEIVRLIDEATGLLNILGNLEDRLDVIHGISLRDGLAARANRDEILSHLWTFLGGNKDKIGKVDNQLKLLGRVAEYRQLAYAHVSATVVKLQAMGAELDELRSRVGAVEVLRDSGRAVPLDVHLEAIRLGVERLESQREKARQVEQGHARQVGGEPAPPGGEKTNLVEAS